mmetsp:Transcript_1948/g.5637  ORF Transcript_1948/g.5637 Transcript_1948/m.5637 type:complete len:205 (+) Transcript_1948:108-722(+)
MPPSIRRLAQRRMPRPRPRPRPRPPPGASAPTSSLLGFFTVSSTLRMTQAASVAAARALSLTSSGSHTKSSKVSPTQAPSMSMPKRAPSPSGSACFWRSLLSMSVASSPAFSHSCRGMTSSALANAAMKSWLLPAMVRACARRCDDNAMSMAPPPGTTSACLTARRTMQMASCSERSDSSMNCSAPPRSTMVHVVVLGQPVKRL